MKDNIHAQSEQRDRPRNEDRSWAGKLRLADKTAVFAAMVADGVGGHRFGAEVAEMAIGALKHAIERATARDFAGDEEVRAWLDTWAPKLQEEVQAAYPLGFSTLCAAIQVGKEAVLLSVGDSPVFQVGSGTGIRRVFEPHTRGQVRIKNGEDEDNIDARDFSVLVRAVGLQQDGGGPLLDFQRVEVTEPTWFLLGSDGVFNYLEGIELFKTISAMKRPGASDIAGILLARSLDNGRKTGKHLDNATVAVLGVMQKTGRKRRQSHARTGGGARRLWIAIPGILLLLLLIGSLVAWFFFRVASKPAPEAGADATSGRAERAVPVSQGDGDAAAEEPRLPPPPPEIAPTPQAVPPSVENVSVSRDGDVPAEESLPAKVALYLMERGTEVTNHNIGVAYADGTPKYLDRTGNYYVIPDAGNVSLIELVQSGVVYIVERREPPGAEGIAVWRLVPRPQYQGTVDKKIRSGELTQTPGGWGVPKSERASLRVDSTFGQQEAGKGENGGKPEADGASDSRKGPVPNYISLQLPNESQEYRGVVVIRFSNGGPISPKANRTYGRFPIGINTVDDIDTIEVDGTAYTNKGQWITTVKTWQGGEYTLISLDHVPDGATPPDVPQPRSVPPRPEVFPRPKTPENTAVLERSKE